MTGRFVRSPNLLVRETLDRVIVLVPSTGELITLMGTGVELWALVAEPVSLEEVSTALGARASVSPQVVRADIGPVVADLAARGVLEGG